MRIRAKETSGKGLINVPIWKKRGKEGKKKKSGGGDMELTGGEGRVVGKERRRRDVHYCSSVEGGVSGSSGAQLTPLITPPSHTHTHTPL